MTLKKISIITPSLNRARLLESAIQSVLQQGYPDLEHIVVDGGSTDGTLELVKKYSHIRLISGPDRGMYDALNKGLRFASGEITGFLNTDDQYGEDVFYEIAPLFDNSDVFAVAGEAIVFADLPHGGRQIIDQYSPAESDLMECSTVGSNYFNAWFFRKSVFEQIGEFCENYQIAGDRDFMFRFALNGLKYVTVERLIYRYRSHSDSLTFMDELGNRKKSADEHIDMTNRYLRNESLSRPVKRLLRQKRTQATLEMAVRYLKLRQFSNMLHYAFAGLLYDLAWPLKFGRAIFQKSPRQG